MTILKKRIIFIVAVFVGASFFIAAFVSAQGDDSGQDTKQPPPTATPSSSLPLIDWAQVQMAPHEQIAPPDPPAADTNPQEDTPDDELTAPPPAMSPTTYTIQPGDTLNIIARRFGVSITSLAAYNNIANPSLIYAGQVISIPDSDTLGESLYTVQPGDTLSRIARRFGVSISALAVANDIANPSFIRVGHVLTMVTAVPTTSPAPSTEPPVPPPADDQIYVVQYGDSLHKIARRFGLSIQTLADINHITNPALIHPGQTLVLTGAEADNPAPSSPPPTETPPNSTFIWPVESRSIVQYSRPGHRAIDLVLPVGSPIYAMADGVIEFAGWNNYGYGNLVVVDHGNGWRTLYAHNSEFKVKSGDSVAQGDVIALSGNTGYSTMPHLHLEMILNQGAVNPCSYLPGGC